MYSGQRTRVGIAYALAAAPLLYLLAAPAWQPAAPSRQDGAAWVCALVVSMVYLYPLRLVRAYSRGARLAALRAFSRAPALAVSSGLVLHLTVGEALQRAWLGSPFRGPLGGLLLAAVFGAMHVGGPRLASRVPRLRYPAAVLAVIGGFLSSGGAAFFALVPGDPQPALMEAVAVMTGSTATFSLLWIRFRAEPLLDRHKDALRAIIVGDPLESLGTWAYDAVRARPRSPDYSLIWILGQGAQDLGLPPPDEWQTEGPLDEEIADRLLEAAEDALEFVEMDVLPLVRSRRRRARLLRAHEAAYGTLRFFQGQVARRRSLPDQALKWLRAAEEHYAAARMPEHAAVVQCEQAMTWFSLDAPYEALAALGDLPDDRRRSLPVRRYAEFLTLLCQHETGQPKVAERMRALQARRRLPFWAYLRYQRELPWAARNTYGARERLGLQSTLEFVLAQTWRDAGSPDRLVAPVSRTTRKLLRMVEQANDLTGIQPLPGGLLAQAWRERSAGNATSEHKLLIRAYDQATAAGDWGAATDAAMQLARWYRVAGDRAAAYRWLCREIERYEDRRIQVLDLSTRQILGSQAFEEAVSLLLDAEHPVPGVDRPAVEAFQLVERARARTLLDLLDEQAPGPVAGGEPIRFEELRALLAEESATGPGRCVLSAFFLTEDHIHVFVVRADRPDPVVRTLIRAAPLDWAIRSQGPPVYPDEEGFDEDTWVSAMQSLLAPVLEHSDLGDALRLVPHRLLHDLPLHAVPLPERPLRDLAERNRVSYSFSASLLRRARPAAGHGLGRALVLADSDAARPLPHSRGEGTAIRAARPPGSTEVHLGTDASRAVLRDRLATEHFDMLHIACHGEFVWKDPLKSFLNLVDGRLTAADILHLPGLRAVSLATLSGCTTGVGRRRGNDEHLGLTSALLQAGVRSVLVSLWEIPDIATGLLMRVFYEQMSAGTAMAEGLRRAQRYVREATCADVIDHCRFLESLDPALATPLQHTVAIQTLYAGDWQRTALELTALVERLPADAPARPGLLAATRKFARFGNPRPDYAHRPFQDPYFWAAFKLFGDAH